MWLLACFSFLVLMSCSMNGDKGSIPPPFLGKWRQVEKSTAEENLLLMDVSDTAAVLTMKSLPGTSKTYTFREVVRSSAKELKVKCSLPDVTLDFRIRGGLLYKRHIFPPPALPYYINENIYYVFERY